MGCVSSKLMKKNVKQKVLFGSGDLTNHVVSLTSTTYGALKLDLTHKQAQAQARTQTQTQTQTQFDSPQANKNEKEKNVRKGGAELDSKIEDELEVINTWELMEDLEEETTIPISNSNSNSNWKGIRSPFKRLVNQVSSLSPKEGNETKLVGKENRGRQQCYSTPRSRSKSGVVGVLKYSSNSTKVRKASSMSMEEGPRRRSNSSSTRRRSLGPLFDPELIESLEKELSLENEQIKEMVMVPKSTTDNTTSIIKGKSSEKVVPPGGEDCVVIYTTTLRGIRKTFEECNAVRAAIESYKIRVIERDISMDSGYKEELRKLMGGSKSKGGGGGVKVPIVYVKGKLIGGAKEIIKLEEDGKLQGLLEGIPKALQNGSKCQGCGGIRFVMCMDCNGSCKLLDPLTQKKVLRCGECNENGLIQCPICC